MRKIVIPAVLALAVGAAALYLLAGRNGLPPGGAPTLGDVPSMSAAEAASHRAARYAAIDSIEDLLGLPGHFARMEALYALAGRADSATVQTLVFQASGIADPSDRKDILLVLFARLAELDPLSALALSRTPGFAADPAFAREVWRRWGGLDLDAALDHAAGLDGPHRSRAAQALFTAYGHWGSEETSLIAERLETQPDNRTRSARIDDLAYTDPAAAIDYVNALDSPLHRRQAAAHLGRLLGRNGLESADRWAALFRDASLRRRFEDAAAQAAAEADPAATLEHLLAGREGARGSRLRGAFRAIAAQDMDQALSWFERLETPQQRRYAGSAIAAQLAQTDPLRALSWAREHEHGPEMSLYRTVIDELSDSAPQLALSDAMNLNHRWRRISALMYLANRVSEHDPRRAVQLMKTVDTAESRGMMMQQITVNWMRSDPDEALDWIMSSDADDRDQLMTAAAHIVSRANVDAALRLLPRLDGGSARVWRQQIAANLASQRSVAEAKSFIAQFEGTPEYPQLVAGVVNGLAEADPKAAVEMLDRVPDSANGQMLSTMVFMHYAQQSPREAAEAAAGLSNDGEQANVLRQVLRTWGRSDLEAAEQWVNGRPRGPGRAQAIAGVSSHWTELTPRRRRMLESIEDPQQRKTAIMNVVFRIAREDAVRAEEALRSINLPAEDREELLQGLKHMRGQAFPAFIGSH